MGLAFATFSNAMSGVRSPYAGEVNAAEGALRRKRCARIRASPSGALVQVGMPLASIAASWK